eukprot:14387157-Ditylum_brightwellii.AAC.1
MERSKQIKCFDGDNVHSDDDSIDSGDKHLAHLTQVVTCCLMERGKQNKCVDDNNGHGVGDSDDSGDKHLTHISQAVDCCLT